jgi:hypothetical protein
MRVNEGHGNGTPWAQAAASSHRFSRNSTATAHGPPMRKASWALGLLGRAAPGLPFPLSAVCWAADARSHCDRGGCCGCAARRSDRIESIQSHERSFWEQGQEHEHCSKNGVMASWEQDQLIRYLIGIIHLASSAVSFLRCELNNTYMYDPDPR